MDAPTNLALDVHRDLAFVVEHRRTLTSLPDAIRAAVERE